MWGNVTEFEREPCYRFAAVSSFYNGFQVFKDGTPRLYNRCTFFYCSYVATAWNRLSSLEGVGVPHPLPSKMQGQDDPPTVRAVRRGRGEKIGFIFVQYGQFCAAFRIPNLYCIDVPLKVCRASDDPSTVRAVRDTSRTGVMSLQCGQFRTAFRVPDPHGIIVGAADDPTTIRGCKTRC